MLVTRTVISAQLKLIRSLRSLAESWSEQGRERFIEECNQLIPGLELLLDKSGMVSEPFIKEVPNEVLSGLTGK